MMKDVPQKEGASIIVILRDGEHDLFGLRGRDVDISHSMFLAMKKIEVWKGLLGLQYISWIWVSRDEQN